MIKHYLTVAFRSMMKDKGFLIVNLTGLSVAVAFCLLLIFWIKFELSYEKNYLDSDRIYQLVEIEKRADGIHKKLYSDRNTGTQLKEQFPQIEAVASFKYEMLPFMRENQTEGDGVVLKYGDTQIEFLQIFSYEYLEGSPETIAKSGDCLITKEAAKKVFGNESPVGKTIIFGSSLRLKIGAVIKLPPNTEIRFDVLSPAGSGGSQQFVMFKKGVKLTPALKEQFEGFLSTMQETESKLELQPIRDIHLNPLSGESTRKMQLWLFSIVALFILLIAIINYINTSIARAMNRIKEVGVRKISGSDKTQLITRFLSDSFILTFFALILALIFTKILFPFFSEIMGLQMDLQFDFSGILIVVLLGVLITLLSGGYAAFYLSRFSPAVLFKGGSSTGSKENLRKALMGLQFFLCIGVLICTFFVYRQINGIFTADTGVDRKNILVLETGLWYQAEDFFQEIKKNNPNVVGATIASNPPFNADYGYSGVSWAGSKDEVKMTEFVEIFCDSHYADVFGLELIAGQFIPPGLTWWQYSTDDSFNIVINEAFQKLMGEENPLGITVAYGWGRKGKIIGVVKDFNFKPLKEKITPLIMSFNPEACGNVYIKTTGQNPQETLNYILQKYDEMKPKYKNQPAIYHTAEQEYRDMYEVELRMAWLFLLFSVVSLFLSIMGVVSMVSFMAEKRTKEIAIRKINGAGIRDIIGLFIREISVVEMIAAIPAIMVAYFLMYQWLNTFVFRISLNWWVFLLVPLLVFVLVAAIMSIQLYSIARKNPLDSLRME